MLANERITKIGKSYNDLELFKFRALEEIKRVKRYPSFVSLLILDLSHLNNRGEIENYRDLGEFYLSLCGLVRKSIRETDIISSSIRGKIAILLIETPKEGANSLAKRLKKMVKYFLCNNIKSPIDWRVPIKEFSFPHSTTDEGSLMAVIQDLKN